MNSTIGIDPGAVTGIALLTDAGTTLYPKSFKWGKGGEAVFTHLRGLAQLAPGEITAVIEKPAAPYYMRKVSLRANFKISQNVGECKAKAMAISAFCQALGWKVIERPPIKGLTKLSVASWKAYFPKYVGRAPSNHARDASMLALWVRGNAGGAKP